MKRISSLLIIALVFQAFPALALNPWVDPAIVNFSPVRTLYVTPTGTGGYTLNYKTSVTSLLSGGVTVVAGLVAGGNQKALQFDGINDNVEFPPTGIATDTTFTITGWVKLSTTGRKKAFIEATGAGPAQLAVIIQDNAVGQVTFQVTNDANTTVTAICTGQATNDNQWHWFAATRNSGSIATYWDSTSPCASNSGAPTTTFTTTRACVARSCQTATQSYYAISADEIKVYNKVLSAGELATDYNSGAGFAAPAGGDLHAAWHFDELTPGDVTNPIGPYSIPSIINAGDLVWFDSGTYTGTPGDPFILNVNGNSTNQILYRCEIGGHCILDGKVNINADWNTLWGFEITDPDASVTCGESPTGGGMLDIDQGSDNVRIINNFIHDTGGVSGTGCQNNWGFWNGTGRIAYGNNSGPGAMGIYTHGTYASHGLLYFIQNIMHDTGDPIVSSTEQNFHAFGTSVPVQGMHTVDNIWYQDPPTASPGSWQTGGKGEDCDYHNTAHNSVFYKSRLDIGYRRPTQVTITDNIIFKAGILWDYFPGDGETRCDSGCTAHCTAAFPPGAARDSCITLCGTQLPLPNIVTGNQIYGVYPGGSGDQVDITSAAYLNYAGGSGVNQCSPTLPNPGIGTGDEWDFNTYSTPLTLQICAGNLANTEYTSLANWRAGTLARGKQYDTNSTAVSMPTTDIVKVYANEYDPKRAHVAAINLDGNGTVNVNFSSAFPLCAVCQIRSANDPYGAVVLQFVNFGTNVAVPQTDEFEAFVVTQVSP